MKIASAWLTWRRLAVPSRAREVRQNDAEHGLAGSTTTPEPGSAVPAEHRPRTLQGNLGQGSFLSKALVSHYQPQKYLAITYSWGLG